MGFHLSPGHSCESAVLGFVSCPQALTDRPPMWAQLPRQTPPRLLILPALLFIPSLQFRACLPPASLTRRPVSPVCLSQPPRLSPPPASELPLSSENCLEFLLLKCFLTCGETTFSSSFQQAALKASSASPWEARSPPRPCTGQRPEASVCPLVQGPSPPSTIFHKFWGVSLSSSLLMSTANGGSFSALPGRTEPQPPQGSGQQGGEASRAGQGFRVQAPKLQPVQAVPWHSEAV